MAPRRTRSQGVATKDERAEDLHLNSKKISKKRNEVDTQGMQETLNENSALKKKLEELKIKYNDKKLIHKELKETIENQTAKIKEQNDYIIKLKQDRKKAEQVHKNNVANLVTLTAQNQALMAVLTTQQQPVHQMFPSLLHQQLQANASPYYPMSNGMILQMPQSAPVYPITGFPSPLTRLDPFQAHQHNYIGNLSSSSSHR